MSKQSYYQGLFVVYLFMLSYALMMKLAPVELASSNSNAVKPAQQTQLNLQQRQQIELIRFFVQHNYQVKLISFSRDQGIRGLQITPPHFANCNEPFFTLLMPEGDELNVIWQQVNNTLGNQKFYLYKGQYYQRLPNFTFWLNSMIDVLEHKMQLIIYPLQQALGLNIHSPMANLAIEPIVAVSAPINCHGQSIANWSKLSFRSLHHE